MKYNIIKKYFKIYIFKVLTYVFKNFLNFLKNFKLLIIFIKFYINYYVEFFENY